MNDDPISPRLARVRRLSLLFRVLCRALLVLAALAFLGLAWPILLSKAASAGSASPTLPNLIMVVVVFCYWIGGVGILERLFNAFATQTPFAPATARWLKRFGFWVGTAFLLPLGARMILDLVIYGRLGVVGEGPFAPLIGCVFMGLFLAMLGWVLEEACELKAEQELTV